MPGIKTVQYQAYDDTVSVDETRVLDDTTAFDETADLSELFNYIFNTASALKYFEGTGVYELPAIALSPIGRVQSSRVDWVANTPAGTSVVCKVAVFDGKWWSAWTPVANGGAIPGLANGRDVTGYKLKVKLETATTDYTTAANITELEVTINSRKIMRLLSDGTLKTAKTMVQNASETL
ncbi:MAG: hypothetical protein ABFD18_06160 [Syntrophomonas sp.]